MSDTPVQPVMTPASVGDDMVHPFQIGDTAVRGRVVRLAGSIDDILSVHGHDAPVSELLGEAALLSTLMGAALKFDGRLLFQAQGSSGPVSVVFSDYTSDGGIRAMATLREGKELGPDAKGAGDLLGPQGHMAVTIDQGPDMDRYQGVTPIEGEDLASAAAAYFKQSEQLPTVIKLAVGRVQTPGGKEEWRAGGIMAQLVASEGGTRERGEEVLLSEDDQENWDWTASLVNTTQADELLDPTLEVSTLLYRLFHEKGVRLFDGSAVFKRCTCHPDKIAAVLAQYSEAELADMVDGDSIKVSCEFCRKDYHFSPTGEFLADR